MRHRPAVPFIGMLLFLGATVAQAQSGMLQGRVADSAGKAIANAIVSVEGSALRTSRTIQGSYVIRGVPAGQRTLRVRAIGYLSLITSVSIAGGATVQHDFTLARSAMELSPIDVTVGSRARHTAAEELAVPVDVFPAEVVQQ